jgi:hypothetical protein
VQAARAVKLEFAQAVAHEIFADHPAAVPLLMQSKHGATQERRRRSWLALLVLDPEMPLPDRWPDIPADHREQWRRTALEGPANAIADLVLTSFYCTDRHTRLRAADLLARVCGEAAAILQDVEAHDAREGALPGQVRRTALRAASAAADRDIAKHGRKT